MTTEELKNATPEDMRRYIEELQEENEKLAGELADLEEERDDLREKLDARDDDEERAADAVADACEKFTKYQGDAGGAWYSRDLREFIDGLADAMGWLACGDASRIESTAPLF